MSWATRTGSRCRGRDCPGPFGRVARSSSRTGAFACEWRPRTRTRRAGGSRGRSRVWWEGLRGAVREGGGVFLADGRIRLRVETKDATSARCRVEVGGPVSSHQGLNLPGADVTLPSAGHDDLAWVDFAVE